MGEIVVELYPDKAPKTVENFLGIPIQYYALVDFTAFERIIDTIGGVCLDIPEKIDVGILYQNGVVTLEPGYQYHVGALKFIYSW